MRIASSSPQLSFPRPVRLRVGDRFVFLPTVERAIEWLAAPDNDVVRGRLQQSLDLLLAAQDSRSMADVWAGYRAFKDGVIRERLVFH